ncbi:MAG TPA: tetratricopeptide repeat protein [Syntrophales bacterium]|nr:tetratricopeptide repeat protein [Syntrophobacterales bacterium]HNQ02291.1 tetratricopeptide repeat protein [Syntrophales bacterium]HQL90749.1 tetratricopeptide repeat protein [Syntrophales bacterium]
MSAITAALRRADRADDERYRPYREIILARPRGRVRGKKRLILGICLASLVLLASTAFSLIVYLGQENAGSEQGRLIAASAAHRARLDLSGRQPEPLAPGGPAADSEILFQAGLRRQQAESLPEAEALYRRAVEADPKNLSALNNLGVICMSQGRDREAIDLFTRLIDVKGDWADPYYNLACLYSRQGDIPKSLWHLRVALWMNRDLKGWAKSDPDLEPLRSRPEYDKIVN